MFLEKGRWVFQRDCLENGCVYAYTCTFQRTTQYHSSISFYSSTVYDKQYTANDKEIFAAMDCVQI